MRAALDLPSVRADSRAFGELVKRLGFVVKPDSATLAYVEGLYGAGRGPDGARVDRDLRHAASVTLGATAAHAYRAGDTGARPA